MTATIQRFEPAHRTPVSQATSIEQSRAVAEVQAAVIVAQNVPRDIQRAVAEMRESCGRMAMAEQAFYSVPNRGTGPSVHLMRELARIWGNIEHGSHELRREDDAGVSEVQAFAWDKQTNTRTSRTFIAPHERMKGGGRQRLTDLGDIQNNNNNVAARAVRECISNVLPRWFTEEAQNRCRDTLENGEGKPLPQRIDEMVNAFKGIGVSARQIEIRLGKKRGQWDAGDVAQMGIVYTSITRDGINRDEEFPPIDAETVDEIACTADTDTKPASKLKGKVKAASSAEQTPGQDGGNDLSRGAEPSSGAQPQADSRDQDPPAPEEAPGAPTANTPGQTDRVAKALENAAKKMPAKSRAVYQENLAALFAEVQCDSCEDQLTIAAEITKHGEVATYLDIGDLTDDDLTATVNTLTNWKSKGEIDDKVRDTLNIADLKAEGGQQQTLDGGTQ
ncbi:hypothetical protein PJN38_24330 [Mycobacterium kansasii]